MFGAAFQLRFRPMTISPVTFAFAPPVAPVERTGRVRRRPQSPIRRRWTDRVCARSYEPMQAAQSAEERVSDATRDALIGMRLGG